jgi:hypothetical protein
VYQKDYEIFQSTSIQIDKKIQRDMALKKTEYRRYRSPRRYTPSEVELLARTDELHGWLSGPAAKKIITRKRRGMVLKDQGYPR